VSVRAFAARSHPKMRHSSRKILENPKYTIVFQKIGLYN
jgi:hypothetical protein